MRAFGATSLGAPRTLFSLLAFGFGAALFFAAPYLTPIPFSSAGFDTSLRLSTLDVSPYNRELQYVVSVLGAAMIFVGLWSAPWRLLAARDYWIATLGMVPLVAVGLAVYGPTLQQPLPPFHEGEWLALLHGAPFPLIHGYAIDYAPPRLAAALFGEDHVIGGARALRLVLALFAYALVPLVYYQAARYAVGHGWANALAVGCALAVFVVFHGTLFTLGAPQHGILHAPVRDVPFIALILTAVWLVVPYRQAPESADRGLAARAAVFGAVAACGVLINILTLAFSAMLAALIAAYLAAGGARIGARLGRFALAGGAGFLLAAGALEVAFAGAMSESFRSFAYFAGTGRVTFSDQLSWIYSDPWEYHETGALMSFITLGVAAVWLLDRARREGARAAFVWAFPYVVCLAAVAFSLFANTGPVTTTFGVALLLPVAFGAYAAETLTRSAWLPALLDSPTAARNAKFVAVAVSMTTLMLAFVGSGVHAFDSAAELVRATVVPNRALFPSFRFAAMRRRLDELGARCTVSLPSDGTLLFALDRPSCLRIRFPIYDASRAGQARMIEDLNAARPGIVHVASATLDHSYPPYMQVPALTRFVLSTYRPDSLIDGRWFWSLSAEPVRRGPPVSPAEMPEMPRVRLALGRELDYKLRMPLPRSLAPDGPWVGILVYLKDQAAPHAALVGEVAGAAVNLKLTVTGELARAGGEMWLVGRGNVASKIAEIDPR